MGLISTLFKVLAIQGVGGKHAISCFQLRVHGSILEAFASFAFSLHVFFSIFTL